MLPAMQLPMNKTMDLYRDLTSGNATRVTVFLDACFSGGGRNAG
jgi:hypothetical protein